MICSLRELTVISLLALTPAAFASEGVYEINQACAVNTGCFDGDSPGFPVTISAVGSYLLTGNLTVPDENTDAIHVAASDVTIDLNGFNVSGPVTCSGKPLVCTPSSGTGSGVNVDDILTRLAISVRNGSITGMGSAGVRLGTQTELSGLRVRWNASAGIDVQHAAIISGSTTIANGGSGISTANGAAITRNVSNLNSLAGISTGNASTARENTTNLNDGDGIAAIDGATISGNTAWSNGGDGIVTGADCLVQRNTVRSNTGWGLDLGKGTAYRENVVNSNTEGTVTGSGFVNMLSNSCGGTEACP